MQMKKEELVQWFKTEAERLYGSILDRVRITEISDRAYRQIEKDIKQTIREAFNGIAEVLGEEENG